MKNEEKLRAKIHNFIDGLTPGQLVLLDKGIVALIGTEAFQELYEPVRHTATGTTSTDPNDLEEGNWGTLYRSP